MAASQSTPDCQPVEAARSGARTLPNSSSSPSCHDTQQDSRCASDGRLRALSGGSGEGSGPLAPAEGSVDDWPPGGISKVGRPLRRADDAEAGSADGSTGAGSAGAGGRRNTSVRALNFERDAGAPAPEVRQSPPAQQATVRMPSPSSPLPASESPPLPPNASLTGGSPGSTGGRTRATSDASRAGMAPHLLRRASLGVGERGARACAALERARKARDVRRSGRGQGGAAHGAADDATGVGMDLRLPPSLPSSNDEPPAASPRPWRRASRAMLPSSGSRGELRQTRLQALAAGGNPCATRPQPMPNPGGGQQPMPTVKADLPCAPAGAPAASSAQSGGLVRRTPSFGRVAMRSRPARQLRDRQAAPGIQHRMSGDSHAICSTTSQAGPSSLPAARPPLYAVSHAQIHADFVVPEPPDRASSGGPSERGSEIGREIGRSSSGGFGSPTLAEARRAAAEARKALAKARIDPMQI